MGKIPTPHYNMTRQTEVINLCVSENEKKILQYVSKKLAVSMSMFIKLHSIAKAREYYTQFKKPVQEIQS